MIAVLTPDLPAVKFVSSTWHALHTPLPYTCTTCRGGVVLNILGLFPNILGGWTMLTGLQAYRLRERRHDELMALQE